MGIKKLDFFPTKDMALALGIGSGWTEILLLTLNSFKAIGKAVQICKKLNRISTYSSLDSCDLLKAFWL